LLKINTNKSNLAYLSRPKKMSANACIGNSILHNDEYSYLNTAS